MLCPGIHLSQYHSTDQNYDMLLLKEHHNLSYLVVRFIARLTLRIERYELIIDKNRKLAGE